MRSALVVGGTGLIGRAVARRLVSAGWRVTVTGRDPGHMPADLEVAGVQFRAVDRDDAVGLASAVGGGFDFLLDCVCFTGAQARVLLPLLGDVGSAAMISSKAVYVDADGNHVNSASPPRFDGPVTERQPTMKPGDMPYNSAEGYGANKVAAEHALLDSGRPVTVLRPSKVHGEGATPPREWYFVKRAVDRRPAILLAGHGRGADHPSAAVNIAALAETVAENPGRRILNAADPDAPDGLTISRTIAALTGHHWREVLLDDSAPTQLGRHPWHSLPPITLDTRAAEALGYRPVGTYAATVTHAVTPLLDQAAHHPAWTPPGVDPDLTATWFDYESEDAWLRTSDHLPT
ncbi:NAD-dependent epimerase/dehydratase family protein [Paractinoplanes atraurantiacus]|uniref:Nucleoside-diphosphate-sugar epimerase n=1 Tax=Paractinoplanes atraurantiacus TaxID=1036182 RepID=A0A285K374_9ACTN|nr:NAD-dependent epimerase/dehydratase family protein [Actinoplanes atraurantiacus]SNY67042.1 Nucleoside-diphosphate-sugar epimerase [Actinoplanes atraurantiacus]